VFRIRALSDLESHLNSLRPEYQSIKKQKEDPDLADEELDFLWEETEKAVSDRWVLDKKIKLIKFAHFSALIGLVIHSPSCTSKRIKTDF